MERRTLGRTGISVSELALGTMMFGSIANADHDDSARIINTAIDAGINLIDTADIYSLGESEEIVGEAIKGRRDELVIATKFGLPMGDEPSHRGGSRRWIIRAIDDSLRRLGIDHIDLYQMHRPDHSVDIDETLSALSDLVRAGKIRAIGSSTFAADAIVESQWASEKHGHERFMTEQPMYSILTRRLEGAVLPTAQRYGMGVLSYSPLNSGWLSGRADLTASLRASRSPSRFDPESERNRAKSQAVRELTALADECGLTMPQLAIGFVNSHPVISSVIIGPRTMQQLEGLVAAAGVRLTGEVLDRIDEIVTPGTDVDAADNFASEHPALIDKTLRRRTFSSTS